MVNTQNKIAERLGLELEGTDMDMRAAKLRERIKKKKKILIILDDIWVFLDLEALGIPSADEHKGCKILMTSRRRKVLKLMGSQKMKILPIELLKEDEAWKLFKNLKKSPKNVQDCRSLLQQLQRL
ncbi:probable disease resistance protein At1g61300 [Gossypium hirsutum]|uniref:Probable disease resistance protein At1g61300 n=1 Tax=Gossypium hirsutum TaxID=3635 RepID=A0ABM2Z787_GOSHI|nr:probable disease resistance protein At1g61300 [Gossypium hirsutum]